MTHMLRRASLIIKRKYKVRWIVHKNGIHDNGTVKKMWENKPLVNVKGWILEQESQWLKHFPTEKFILVCASLTSGKLFFPAPLLLVSRLPALTNKQKQSPMVEMKSARAKYFADCMAKHNHQPRVLFSTLNTLINPTARDSSIISSLSCEIFLHFFVTKISAIRCNVFSSGDLVLAPPVCTVILNKFYPISLSHLRKVVSDSKPSSYPFDPIPPWIIKDTFDSVGPFILSIINHSLITGQVPEFFKHALVQPLIKKVW